MKSARCRVLRKLGYLADKQAATLSQIRSLDCPSRVSLRVASRSLLEFLNMVRSHFFRAFNITTYNNSNNDPGNEACGAEG